jgi:hypothetical protein
MGLMGMGDFLKRQPIQLTLFKGLRDDLRG